MAELPKISDEMVDAFVADQASRLGYSTEPDGSYMRMWREPTSFERVRAGLSAVLVASGWRPEADVLREAAQDLLECHYERSLVHIETMAGWLVMRADLRDRASALEQAQPLPVADGSTADADVMADDEQSRHPQAFQLLYDAYRHLGCPAAVDPVDPDDCASVAEESVRVLIQEGLLLPSGGEVSAEWSVVFEDGFRAKTFDERLAQIWFADPQAAIVRPIERRTTIVWPDGTVLLGPWSPVVPDNSETEKD